MNELLIAVIVVLVWFTISGYRRGFVKIFISLASIILTLWLVAVVTPYITTYLEDNTEVFLFVKEKVNESFADANSKRDNTIEENQIETIHSYDVPDTMKNVLISNNNSEVYQHLMVTAFEDYISSFIAKAVLNIIAYITTFIMIMIVLKMTFLSMELIANIPIIKGINKIAGMAAGFVEGLLVVWVCFLAATVFLGNQIGNMFFNYIESSRFLSALYDYNILLQIIYSFI